MPFLVLVLLSVGVAAAAFYWVKRQERMGARPPAKALPSLNRNVFTLQIGDIVQYEGRDWSVEGQLTYHDNGFSWLEYMLQDGEDIRWLSASEDDVVEVCWLQSTGKLDISGRPPQQIECDGDRFEQTDSGTAQMERRGTVQRREAETCRYYDYAAGQRRLSIENWDGEIEVCIGERIHPRAFVLLPGSGERLYS